ncbi:MAG: pyridoxamine 5'-phosphate oxidase family protein [Ornithinimicrobium sp.]
MNDTEHSTPGPPSSPIEHLSESDCWKFLRATTTGRVAVIRDGAPDIFPVNHVVDHGSVVYRTHVGLLFRATLHHDVAFEVDGYDAEAKQAWSVVLRGMATEGRQITDIMEALELPLAPQQPGAKPRIVRITPREVSGRRFTVVERPAAHPNP